MYVEFNNLDWGGLWQDGQEGQEFMSINSQQADGHGRKEAIPREHCILLNWR